ncbi:MAG TPA: hypothetical protein VNV44_05440 [Solirubrobacteraceae bacterium]|nr:hypothetical protein [Solirubrobacteraceae bacterium]
MSARHGAQLLAGARAALGAVVLVAPEAVLSRWLGAQNARRGAVKALGRGLAARDIGLALASLQTLDDPVIGPRVLAACALADAVDALAALLERESLPALGAAATVAVAGGAAAAGLVFARRIADGD